MTPGCCPNCGSSKLALASPAFKSYRCNICHTRMNHGEYCPTPETIAACCAEFQASWSELEEWKHSVRKAVFEAWTVPELVCPVGVE